MLNENSKAMTLAKIEYLYAKITGQTLLNYIRAGLCTGSPLAADGVVQKGKDVYYLDRTVFEAATAKSMLEQKFRKLDMAEVAIARQCANVLLNHCVVQPFGHDLYIESSQKVLQDTFQSIISSDPEYTAIKIGKRKSVTVRCLRELTAEWLMKFLWFSSISIDEAKLNYFIFSKQPIVPVEKIVIFDELKIYGKNGLNYGVIFKNGMFNFVDNVTDGCPEYRVPDRVLVIKDKIIRVN